MVRRRGRAAELLTHCCNGTFAFAETFRDLLSFVAQRPNGRACSPRRLCDITKISFARERIFNFWTTHHWSVKLAQFTFCARTVNCSLHNSGVRIFLGQELAALAQGKRNRLGWLPNVKNGIHARFSLLAMLVIRRRLY